MNLSQLTCIVFQEIYDKTSFHSNQAQLSLGIGLHQKGSLQAIKSTHVCTSSASARQWERNREIALILLRLVDTLKLSFSSPLLGGWGQFSGLCVEFLDWIRNKRNRHFSSGTEVPTHEANQKKLQNLIKKKEKSHFPGLPSLGVVSVQNKNMLLQRLQLHYCLRVWKNTIG